MVLPSVELLLHTQLLGYFQDYLIVALGLADGFNGLLLKSNTLEMGALPGIGDDILYFQCGVGRQDNIGIKTIIFQPGMLGDDTFYLGILEGIDRPVAVVPAGDAAGSIRPDHVDFGAALLFGDRIGIFDKLVFSWRFLAAAAHEGEGRVENSFLDQGLGNKLFSPGIDGRAAGRSSAARSSAGLKKRTLFRPSARGMPK